jgi:hypothetical protein
MKVKRRNAFVTQVGPVAFKTRQEAESGMMTIKVCETK